MKKWIFLFSVKILEQHFFQWKMIYFLCSLLEIKTTFTIGVSTALYNQYLSTQYNSSHHHIDVYGKRNPWSNLSLTAVLQILVRVARQSPHADFSSRSGPLLVCLANNISLKVHFEGSDSHGCPPSRSCRGLVMEPLAPYLYKEWSWVPSLLSVINVMRILVWELS